MSRTTVSKLVTPAPTVERGDVVVAPPAMVDLSEIQIPSSPATPWRRERLATVAACNTVAVLLMVLGWFQASDSAVVNRQVGWLNLAIGGLSLAAIGNILWIRRQRRALVSLVDQGHELWDWIARSAGSESGHAPHSAEVRLDVEKDWAGALVSGSGMRLFHRPGCPFVGGKTVTGQLRRAHEAAGRTACAVCQP